MSLTVDLARNGHSKNGSSNTPRRPKKRLRKPGTWKRNAAKMKRAMGEEYQSPSTGKVVPARATGIPCRCQRKCFEKITDEEKKRILEAFYGLGSKDLQDANLFGLICSNEIKCRPPRTQSSRSARTATYTYQMSITFIIPLNFDVMSKGVGFDRLHYNCVEAFQHCPWLGNFNLLLEDCHAIVYTWVNSL